MGAGRLVEDVVRVPLLEAAEGERLPPLDALVDREAVHRGEDSCCRLVQHLDIILREMVHDTTTARMREEHGPGIGQDIETVGAACIGPTPKVNTHPTLPTRSRRGGRRSHCAIVYLCAPVARTILEEVRSLGPIADLAECPRAMRQVPPGRALLWALPPTQQALPFARRNYLDQTLR